jgi:hypothetical protein
VSANAWGNVILSFVHTSCGFGELLGSGLRGLNSEPSQ